MQPEPHWQERTLTRFLQLSRLHLGLIQAPAAVRQPRRAARPKPASIFRTRTAHGTSQATCRPTPNNSPFPANIAEHHSTNPRHKR
jgi:hypothetical protein